MQHLLLLHGAIGSKEQLYSLTEAVGSFFKIHTLNFSGHGGNNFPEADFSIALFAEEVVTYLKQNQIEYVHVFGYSMGGYVAMYLAKHHPSLVQKVITLATKFNWDETIAAKEVKMLQPDVIELKIPAFAHTLKERHAPNDWKQVLYKTADMLKELGKNNALQIADYANIQQYCLLMLGDRDTMVTLEETNHVYKQIPKAALCVLPNTAHPIEQVSANMLSYHIQEFLLA